MKFTKMHGIGNDYVYVNCFEETVLHPEEVSRFVSDRHFGIGSDGLILICPSEIADCRMRMFNSDGSEGKMCGNGIRCVGKYAYDHGIVDKTQITVETLGGLQYLDMKTEQGRVTEVTVDLGIPRVTSQVPEEILVQGKTLQFTGIDVGSPHAVYFVEDNQHLNLEEIGPSFEWHERFLPDRVNTEFIVVKDRSHLSMRVWERGSGETWACGTGATASVVAASLGGFVDNAAEVELRGGKLWIRWDRESGHVFMTGPAVEVFSGEIALPERIERSGEEKQPDGTRTAREEE